MIAEIEAEVGSETEAQQPQAQSVAAPLEANVARLSTSAEKEATANVSKQVAPKKKQEKAPKQPPKPAVSRDPFEDATLQVAQVQVVERHPDADSLYVCQVALGEETRQLVTGLVKYYSVEELQDRLIVVITNLKASKLRGKESNAMLLAGDDSATSKQGLVKLLAPPQGAEVGDRVYLEGQQPSADPAACLNHKQWGKVVPEFAVVGGKATYKGQVLVTKDGPLTVPDLPDGSGIH